jgi:hypothetical protein
VPYSHLPRETAEPLEALERLLLRHRVIGEEQARAAARLITGDETFVFPQPRLQHPAPTQAAEEGEKAPPAE